jgi:hypothetical protein
MIKVRIRNPETIRTKLRPKQGIKVGDSNKYLYDPDLILDAVEDARDWAIKTDGLVDEEDYSSKAWAIGGEGTETNNAKYYAEQAQESAELAYQYRSTYIHTQGVAASTWTINHNLNKYPSVTVVDSAENEIIASVKYQDANTCIIEMSSPFKGKAYLN